MANDGRLSKDLPTAVVNAVVPNLFREAGVAIMLIAQPIPGTENDPNGALYRSNGPMRYSIKGLNMDSVQGKEFAIQFLGYAQAGIIEDLVAQLQAEAERMASQTVPPPEGTDAK